MSKALSRCGEGTLTPLMAGEVRMDLQGEGMW